MLRVGVIGLGQIGWSIDEDPQRKGIWSHVGAYQNSPHTEIVAVSSRKPEVCQTVQRKFGIANYYVDYRAMLDTERLDIVSICTPIATHHDIVMDSVNAGVNAVFCEKTLAYDLAEAEEMVNACDEHGIVFAVNYPRRWDSMSLHVLKLLEHDAIGELRSIVAYGATALHTSTSHLVDLMCLYAGKPLWVVGESATEFVRTVHGVDDPGGIGMVRFESGAIGFIKGSSLSPGKYMSELDLVGTHGRIRLIDDGADCLVYRFAESRESPGSGFETLVEEDSERPATNERMLDAVADIVDRIGDGGEPASSGCSSLQSLSIIEGMKQSAQNGNIKVQL